MPCEYQRRTPSNLDVRDLLMGAETMQTSHNLHLAQFMRLCYDGSILLFYALGLAMSVALIAYVLETIAITL
jgi:hypothetical protein